MATELTCITRLLKELYSMDISFYTNEFLAMSLAKRMKSISRETVEGYCSLIQNDRGEAEAFLRSLNVTFSQFFRDDVNYALLGQVVIPAIAAKKQSHGEIRVWSAGCADGQEAYSIAILLAEYNRLFDKALRFRIFATDITTEALAVGRAGIYHEESIQNVKTVHLKKYFCQQNKDYAIVPNLKKHVEFFHYDLLNPSTKNPPESIYGDFDIILCSNVCMYYNDNCRTMIMHKLQDALSQAGIW